MLSIALMRFNFRRLFLLNDLGPSIMARFRYSRLVSMPALRYQGHIRPP